jgi:hypothetical protein
MVKIIRPLQLRLDKEGQLSTFLLTESVKIQTLQNGVNY